MARTRTDAEVVAKTAEELLTLADNFEGLAWSVPGLSEKPRQLRRTAMLLKSVGKRLLRATGGDEGGD